jgi:anaerobic magnesium-protoporphyrin IX monomethyl ester cyclase
MNCSYCYNAGYRKLYGCNTLRVRPVEDIILEIEELRKFSLELIYFNDDVFPVYKPDWLFKFCKEYRKIHVPFHIQLRIELLAEDALKALKDAGLHGVTFAIESGDQCYRANTLNRHVTDEMILRGANMLHEYGIKFRAENMVGLPGETWDQSMKTLDLNIRCKPDIGWGAVYQPYPGTKLGDMCTRRGMFDGKVDRFSESFFERSVLSSPGMERFERLQKLFPLLVAHPSLRKIAKLLCQLPLDGMYRRLYTWYKKRLFLKRLYKT